MKSVHYVLTIVLTGEWVAGFLANNMVVLALIIGVLFLWHRALKVGPASKNEPSTRTK